MARQLFGTDGIRGVAGEYPLDRATARAVGAALGAWILATRQTHRICPPTRYPTAPTFNTLPPLFHAISTDFASLWIAPTAGRATWRRNSSSAWARRSTVLAHRPMDETSIWTRGRCIWNSF